MKIATRPHTTAGVTRQVPAHMVPRQPRKGGMAEWIAGKRKANPDWRVA